MHKNFTGLSASIRSLCTKEILMSNVQRSLLVTISFELRKWVHKKITVEQMKKQKKFLCPSLPFRGTAGILSLQPSFEHYV